MTPEANAFRAMREATRLSLREVARRTDINPGRLSIIERGVTPTEDERARLNDCLGKVLIADPATDTEAIA